MRIVQTFWSAGRNPLEHGFGWLRPEYNLMSWALSCLCLRKYYDEVALYTDEQGKRVLIDLLHLPYTEVNVVYDETLCLPQHWAYAKIKTYSLQTKPFLHIDGDIFLSKPIPEDVINAPLIAQNREIGTMYYKRMMDRILQESAIKLPQYIEDGLKEESIASYNMGIFGGNDLKFIGEFCKEAMALCDSNKDTCTDGNFNLLFEQMLFAHKVARKELNVSTIIPKIFNDNGYTVGEFCDLGNPEKWFFHLLGGHKRNTEVIESLVRTVIILHPDWYRRIILLFPYLHLRGLTKGMICIPLMFSDTPIKPYIDFLNHAEEDWSALSWEELLDVESRCIRGNAVSRIDDLADVAVNVCCNPYMKCYDVPTTWSAESLQKIRERLFQKEDVPIQEIAIIPSTTSILRKEYVLFELESQVLEMVKDYPMRIPELLNALTQDGKKAGMTTLWLSEIRILLNEGLLIPDN